MGKMIIQSVAIAFATCFLCSISMSLSDFDELSTHLKTVTEVNASLQLISGPNGYCIAVSDNNYSDGTGIILRSCDSSTVNQLWTFHQDGTLRSNGKCLTTDGFSQRSRIMINSCDSVAKDATLWQLQSDGEIVNPTSGLVLTSLFGQLNTQLTLEKSISSLFQTWRVDNNSNPSLVTIVGMNSLCLQLSDIGVTLRQCGTGNIGERWFLYPDGTIRPTENTNHCLGFDNLPNRQIVSFTCGLGPSSQRWLFTNDKTILNERTNLVFDVVHSEPSFDKIIVFPSTGKPNQKWDVLFH